MRKSLVVIGLTLRVGRMRKSVVFRGSKAKTGGGLTREMLKKSSSGKIVSKKASARAKKNFAGSKLKLWSDALKKARKAMGIKGFVPVGGKSTQGRALLAKVKSLL